MTHREYVTAARSAAEAQELTGDDVRALDYVGIAALAGVEVGPSGGTPPTFHFKQVRRVVAVRLDRDARAQRIAENRTRLQAAAREVARFANATVKHVGGSVYEVDRTGHTQ